MGIGHIVLNWRVEERKNEGEWNEEESFIGLIFSSRDFPYHRQIKITVQYFMFMTIEHSTSEAVQCTLTWGTFIIYSGNCVSGVCVCVTCEM